MTELEKRQTLFELELVGAEVNEFHDACDARDDENGLMPEPVSEYDADWFDDFVNGPGVGEHSDAEMAYLFGRYENAEIVNDAYAELDEQLF